MGCGLLRRETVVLPWTGRLADLDARWSETLLKPSPKAHLAERVRELAATRADAIAAHGAEPRRIERDPHDGARARLVSPSMRIGLAQRAYDRDPEGARRLLVNPGACYVDPRRRTLKGGAEPVLAVLRGPAQHPVGHR